MGIITLDHVVRNLFGRVTMYYLHEKHFRGRRVGIIELVQYRQLW